MQQSVVSPTKEGAGILIRTINPGDGINYPKLGDSCLVGTVLSHKTNTPKKIKWYQPQKLLKKENT